MLNPSPLTGTQQPPPPIQVPWRSHPAAGCWQRPPPPPTVLPHPTPPPNRHSAQSIQRDPRAVAYLAAARGIVLTCTVINP